MYITNYNLNRLLYNITIDETDQALLQRLIDELVVGFDGGYFKNLLSLYELKRLISAKQVFASTIGENIPNNIKIIKLRYVENTDNGHFLYPPNPNRKPAYHKDIHCERLNADYENYKIPDAIQSIARHFAQDQKNPEKGLEFINLYRSIYKRQLDSLFEATDWQARNNTFRAEAFSKYNIDVPESALHKPEEIILENSKPVGIAVDMKQAMFACLNKLDNFRQQGNNNEAIKQLYQWRYLPPSKRKELAQIRGQDFIQANATLSQLKYELYTAIINYLKIQEGFNQENINETLLQKLGFVPCGHCIPVTIDDLI